MPQAAQLTIRPMAATDIHAVGAIISEFSTADGKLTRSYYETYFEQVHQAENNLEQNHVAELEDQVVGVTGLCPDKYRWPGILWINWLYVSPSHRRRGIGTALLDFSIETARGLGGRKLYLDTSSDASYSAATALYEKSGFVLEGKLRDYYEEDEHFLIFGVSLAQ